MRVLSGSDFRTFCIGRSKCGPIHNVLNRFRPAGDKKTEDCIRFEYGRTMERVMGIEPTFSAWEADVLPLNYTRARRDSMNSRRPDKGRVCSQQKHMPNYS